MKKGARMKLVRHLSIDELIKYRSEISSMLKEVYCINLPHSNITDEQIQNMIADLCKYLEDGSAVLLGVFDKESLCGFLWAYRRYVGNQKRMHLNHIAIKASSRGLGMGKMLIIELEAFCQKEGFDAIELMASISNKEAMGLYKNKGFEIERVQFFKNFNKGS